MGIERPIKTHYVGFRIEKALYDQLEERARALELPVSAYLRRVVKHHLSRPEIRPLVTPQL